MYEFQYHRAASVEDAARLLASETEAKVLAGGMSLVPLMKLRLTQASDIIDLRDLDDLKGITAGDGTLTIRAMTTHATVAASPDVAKAIPALASLAGEIGDPHCRNRGTIGGSLAHADPVADYPSAVLALGATIRTNRREIAGEEFFAGMFETALEPGELITEVAFPIPARAAYIKFPQPASRFALCGVFVAEQAGTVRVGVTGCANKAFRARDFEEALSASFTPEAVNGCEVAQDGLNTDIYADPEYRAHLIKVLTRRAVAACAA